MVWAGAGRQAGGGGGGGAAHLMQGCRAATTGGALQPLQQEHRAPAARASGGAGARTRFGVPTCDDAAPVLFHVNHLINVEPGGRRQAAADVAALVQQEQPQRSTCTALHCTARRCAALHCTALRSNRRTTHSMPAPHARTCCAAALLGRAGRSATPPAPALPPRPLRPPRSGAGSSAPCPPRQRPRAPLTRAQTWRRHCSHAVRGRSCSRHPCARLCP